MRLLDRIRALFTSDPTVGNPSTGRLMDRGGGEEASHYDDTRDPARGHDLAAPNDAVEDHVRPPLS